MIAETLARQTLVDRLIRNWYSSDTRFHGGLKGTAERALAACTNVDCMKSMGGEYRETTWKLRSEGADAASDVKCDRAMRLNADEWKNQLEQLATKLGATANSLPTGRLSSLEETPEAFVVTAVRAQRKGEIATASVKWSKRPFDAWWSAKRLLTSKEVLVPVRRYALATPTDIECVNDTWESRFYVPSWRQALPTGPEGSWRRSP